ncbi:hypothetical protein D3C87_270440 [compost metagenome]
MKKSIQIIGVLALALVTIFACKKDGEELEKEERFSVGIKVASEKGGTENAILIGSKADLKAALTPKAKPVFLKKVSSSNNVFVPVLDDVTPVNPGEACWAEVTAYAAAHMAEWQQMANQTCTTVLRCITCPNAGGGLFVMYAIAPNSINCTVLELEMQHNFVKFNFNDNELNGEAVASVIRSNR